MKKGLIIYGINECCHSFRQAAALLTFKYEFNTLILCKKEIIIRDSLLLFSNRHHTGVIVFQKAGQEFFAERETSEGH